MSLINSLEDPLSNKYEWEKFNFSIFNAASTRIKILHLREVYNELEELYSKTTNFYSQAIDAIKKILRGSKISFSHKIEGNSLEEKHIFYYQIYFMDKDEPENSIKIEDLKGRSIAKYNHCDNQEEKDLYKKFNDLFVIVDHIINKLRSFTLKGFDFSQNILNSLVKIANSDFSELYSFKNKIENYFDELTTFLKNKNYNKWNIQDFISTKKISRIETHNHYSYIQGLKYFILSNQNMTENEDLLKNNLEKPVSLKSFKDKYQYVELSIQNLIDKHFQNTESISSKNLRNISLVNCSNYFNSLLNIIHNQKISDFNLKKVNINEIDLFWDKRINNSGNNLFHPKSN